MRILRMLTALAHVNAVRKHEIHMKKCIRYLRCAKLRTHAAPKHNPQNVPDPVVIQPATLHIVYNGIAS